MRPPVAPVVPDADINALLQEKAQVKRMRVVDHVLVKHRVGIAKDECGLLFVMQRSVCVVDLFAAGWEKHRVNDGAAGFAVVDPAMFALECFCKDVAHLLGLSE